MAASAYQASAGSYQKESYCPGGGKTRRLPSAISLSHMRRVIDCVLPSGAVNRNSVCCGLAHVSCVRTARRWLTSSIRSCAG